MTTATAREAIRKALQGLARYEAGIAAYQVVTDQVRAARGVPDPSPEELDLWASQTVGGRRAVVEMQWGRELAQTYGTVALALLFDEFLGAGEPARAGGVR